ncbi:hypothetical protein ABIB25_004712 [Nakamurella sp. UYEF19]|uniref:AAA family ATPase n=1 Tax=Nakamurella sp. UYEF19 TaxID=1756392 RepID=UPI00339719A9
MDSRLVGRETVLDQARRVLATAGGVLLEGPAGIGKTSVWQVLGAEPEAAGSVVLSAAPTESERRLPCSALADLDQPSERALAFALRRLSRAPALLLAVRTEGSEPPVAGGGLTGW